MKAIIKTIIIFFLASCKPSNDNEDDKIKTFDLKDFSDFSPVKLSGLGAVDIEYIPLETNELSVIDHFDIRAVGNRLITGEGFFIIKQFNNILRFRDDGSFINKIGVMGRGPDEFTVAHDIDISKEDQKLFLASGWQEKFNVYSVNGEYLRMFSIPFRSSVQFRYENNLIICYQDNLQGTIENSYVVLDTMGNSKKHFQNKFPYTLKNKSGAGVGKENLFYQFNNKLYKKEVYSDTIYVFDNMEFVPHLVLSVGERLLTPEARSENELRFLAENYVRPVHLFEFDDYIYYEYNYSIIPNTDNYITGFIGSKTNDYHVFINADIGLINDLDGGPNIQPKAVREDNTLISWIDAIQLKNYVASDAFQNSNPKYPDKKKELEELAEMVKETDNPILVLVYFRK